MLLKPFISGTIFLFCVTQTTAAIKPDLHVESEIGVQSGVPDAKDGTPLKTYPFCALQFEPSWSESTEHKESYSASLPLNAMKYIGGSGDFYFGPEICFEKALNSSTFEIFGTANYTYMPAAFDQSVPDSYFECILEYDQRSTGTRSFGGNYALSLLREIGTRRMDIKNRLQGTSRLTLSSRWQLFFKLGCTWNLSNFSGGGYIQPNAAGGATCVFNSKKMLLAQLFGSYGMYETTRIPILIRAGKKGNGKIKDTLLYDSKIPDMPFASLYTDYVQELLSGTHIHFIYMLTLFGLGSPVTINYSHQLSIMLEWNNK